MAGCSDSTCAGRTSVITGAASGMGAEVARELDRRGARLALIDRNAEGLAALAADLSGTGHTTHVVDLTDDDAVFALAAEIEASHPHVQTLDHVRRIVDARRHRPGHAWPRCAGSWT